MSGRRIEGRQRVNLFVISSGVSIKDWDPHHRLPPLGVSSVGVGMGDRRPPLDPSVVFAAAVEVPHRRVPLSACGAAGAGPHRPGPLSVSGAVVEEVHRHLRPVDAFVSLLGGRRNPPRCVCNSISLPLSFYLSLSISIY